MGRHGISQTEPHTVSWVPKNGALTVEIVQTEACDDNVDKMTAL